MRLVFVHGWGYDADFWSPLRQALEFQDTFAVDLGFRGERRDRIPFPSMPYVAVGHSLGVQWLLRNACDHPWKAFIAINGFTRFTKADDFAEGIDKRILKRMIRGLEQDTEKVTADFLSQCGEVNPDINNLDQTRLLEGLHHLAEWDERMTFGKLSCPVLALAGDKDHIVPEPLSRVSFADKVIFKQDGDHLLPRSATRWTANEIMAFLEGLS